MSLQNITDFGYNLTAYLENIKLKSNIKNRTTDRVCSDRFVTVSVDDQQWQGSKRSSGQELSWSPDHLLRMRASSRVKIEVFRNTLVPGEKYLLGCSIERVMDLVRFGGHFGIAGVGGVVKLRFVPYRAQDAPESDALAPHLLFDKLSDRITACTSVSQGGDEGSQQVDLWVRSLARAAQRTSDLIELLDISDQTPKFFCLITISVCENLKAKIASLSKPAPYFLVDAMAYLDEVTSLDAQNPEFLPKTFEPANLLGLMSMTVAVLIDEHVYSSTTQIDETMTKHVEDIKEINELLKWRLNFQLNLDTCRVVQRMQYQLRRDKLFQWLDAPDPSRIFNEMKDKHHPTTCSWLLNGDKFLKWKETTGSVLWVYGPPGCGKTVLCSATRDDSVPMVYFFFNKGESAFLQHDGLIRSLVKQLLVQCEPQYDPEVSTHWQPSLKYLYTLLRQLLAKFERVYVVVDAVDECLEFYTLLDWIQDFTSWNEFKAHVHLLVTSRDEIHIQDCLLSLSTIQVYMGRKVVDPDIRTFIDCKLQSGRITKRWGEEERKAIQADISEGSQGIFRRVDYFLKKLGTCYNKRELNNALGEIRNRNTLGLNRIYDW